MNYTLLATPAEGLSGRFLRMDQKRYGEDTGGDRQRVLYK